MSGRISLLVSKDLQVLVQAANTLDAEVGKQFRAHTRRVAEPVLKEEVTGRVGTRLQARVLADTARVSVSNTNVIMKSAQIGKVRGTSTDVLKGGAEFGADPSKVITVRRRGKTYRRRLGNAFLLPRSRGYVFHPATKDAIPRLASLWFQTAYRTVAETFEKAGA